MPFPSTVSAPGVQADGIPGELAFEGPLRAAPYLLNSANAAANIFGRALTVVSEGVAQAGGAGVFAGILANPKAGVSYGTAAGGPLAANAAVPNGTIVEAVDMGFMFVTISAASAIGNIVFYNTTTGANAGLLTTAAPGTTPPTDTALVPNAKVVRYTPTGAGLAVIQLTN